MPSKNPSQCQPLQSCNGANWGKFQRHKQPVGSMTPASTSSTTNKVGSDLEFHEEEFIGSWVKLQFAKTNPQVDLNNLSRWPGFSYYRSPVVIENPEVHDILHQPTFEACPWCSRLSGRGRGRITSLWGHFPRFRQVLFLDTGREKDCHQRKWC